MRSFEFTRIDQSLPSLGQALGVTLNTLTTNQGPISNLTIPSQVVGSLPGTSLTEILGDACD